MNNRDPKQEGEAIRVHKKYRDFRANRSAGDANTGRLFYEELWEAIQRDYRDSGHCYYVENVANGRYEWIRVTELSLLYAMQIGDQLPDLSRAKLPYQDHNWYESMDNTDGTATDVREWARLLIERKKKLRAQGDGVRIHGSYPAAGEKAAGQYGQRDDRQQNLQEQTDRGAANLTESDIYLDNALGNDRYEEPEPSEESVTPPPVSRQTQFVQWPAFSRQARSVRRPPVSQQAQPIQQMPVGQQAQPVQRPPVSQQAQPIQQMTVGQQAQSVQQPPIGQQEPPAQQLSAGQQEPPVRQPRPDTEQQAREQERHIRQLQELMRQERLDWDAQVADQPDQMLTQQLEQTRGDMVASINGLKRDWGKMLEDNFTQLQQLQQQQEQTLAESVRRMQEQQHQLAGSLRSWQKSLYIASFKELANCYAQLYRIVIRQERLCAELEAQGELRTADKELKESLTTFRRIFEKALAPLNLFILVPKVGDPYDDVIHITEQQSGDEQQLAGATVAECVLPGVVHRPENAEDAEDYDVICRATVRLNN